MKHLFSLGSGAPRILLCAVLCSCNGSPAEPSGDEAAAADGGPPGSVDPKAYSPASCAGHVAVPNTGNGNRNIEFLAMGDVHFEHPELSGCSEASRYQIGQNDLMLRALNGIETQRWPNGHGFIEAGMPFAHLRGVLVAGDVTDDGGQPLVGSTTTCPEWETFESTYGLCGDRMLRYPVYEGYGNHDFPFRDHFDETFHPVVANIAGRNYLRQGLTLQSANAHAHYAWRWDDIHFVNLDVKPSGTPSHPYLEQIDKSSTLGERLVNPLAALTFLDNYLGSDDVKPNSQVVLMTHYGPDNGSRITPPEKVEFCDLLAKYKRAKGIKVIAWIHGHTHHTDFYQWTCPAPDQAITIPVFNVGSPFYGVGVNDGRAHFAAFRIGNHFLDAVDVSVANAAPSAYEIPGHEVAEPASTYDPDGTLGGWAVHLPIDAP